MLRGPLLLALIAPLVAAQTPASYAGLRWRDDRTLPRRPHRRRRRHPRPAQRLLHRRQQRRRLEDRRLRPHLEAHLRRPAHRLHRRHRPRPLRPQHHLRRQRRRPAAARSLRRRRHVQVHRRRQDLAASRTARRPADPRHPRRSAQSQPPLRRRPRPSLRPQPRARRLPLHRRRPVLAEGALQGRTHRRHRPRLRPAQSRRPSTPSSGRRSRDPGRTARSPAPTAASSNPPTAAPPGTRSPAACPPSRRGLGRIGIAVAPSDPNRMYALVEARGEAGGVYRSDDAGATWKRVNSEQRIYGRGSDFACVRVDPKNKDVIYVANTSTYRSDDAGQSFTAIKGAPGGDDYHTIWINPNNPDIILLAADQGATISVNDGRTWSSAGTTSPPRSSITSITDNQMPYWVYGGQQESGSVGIASRGNDGADHLPRMASRGRRGIRLHRARSARSQHRLRRRSGTKLRPHHRRSRARRRRSGNYRYLRTAPLLFSHVDPHVLYLGAQMVLKTTDGGRTLGGHQSRSSAAKPTTSPPALRPTPTPPNSSPPAAASSIPSRPRASTSTSSGPAPTMA